MGDLFNKVKSFFIGADQIPWCDSDIVAGCEREVAQTEKGSSQEKNECIMRLSWALVHSRRPDDVRRGIAMLEALLSDTDSSPEQMREKGYLLAVGYFRSGDYPRSKHMVERCLEVQPDWRQALNLEKAIEDRITRDGVIGIGIAATAAAVLAGGLATALARRS
ncbi:hypothetical protein DCAR_0934803 [Daucus carota subsp. sativus]|uniref:Mitochondrial fission 1 protein n=1 Tax=Daucus carota subsp. sativus TaxID=79200 RepID=A0AAF0XVW6_DAUCS|nr:PREDICTED: mitochondrial fission 1 protein A-like [Daucus carota subsp. sativus]XP_017227711.1 PREDICTED: mitochondrial fission 1 protein A-like [Daucus carota subsp. sativus]WOH15266.1 hypothetical protein DCAR_0934803 [Daucus carota subsp. sativus]